MSGIVEVRRGESPLILSVPHAGTVIPDDLARRLADGTRALRDTDWWLDRLYGPLAERFDATLVRATLSRTFIDVNRDPSGHSLYPGQATTGLVPLETFDGEPLYRDNEAPGGDEIEARKRQGFAPYHEALAAEIDRVRARHGHALLYDCHSIRSRIPRLFEGELPVFNIGTFGGRSCAPAVQEAVVKACAASGESFILNGRFQGGWITRHYGRPAENVHAVQMEIAQRAYMDETPPAWREERADTLREHLARVLTAMLEAGNGAEMGETGMRS